MEGKNTGHSVGKIEESRDGNVVGSVDGLEDGSVVGVRDVEGVGKMEG